MKTIGHIITFIFLGVAILGHSHAQEQLPFDKAVSIALENNHMLKSAGHDLTASTWGKWNAVTNFLPKVEFSQGITQIDQETVARANAAVDFVLENAKMFHMSSEDLANFKPYAYRTSYATAITAVQPIFNGGLEIVGLRAAMATQDKSESSYEETEQSIIAGVRTAYLNVLKAQEMVSLTTESIERTKRYLATTQRREELGSQTKTDVLRWEVQLASDEGNQIATQNYLAMAKLQLNNFLGVDMNKEYILESIVTIDFTRDTLVIPQIQIGSLTGNSIQESMPVTFDKLADHPSMRVMESNLRLSEIGVSKEWTNFLPRFNVAVQYGWEQNGTPALDGIRPWAIALKASYPIFSSFGDVTKLEKAYAERQRTEEQVESFKVGLLLQARNAQLSLAAANKRADIAYKGLRQAQSVLDHITHRYETGGASPIDLLDVQTAYTAAKSNYINAIYDYYIAEIDYARATGMMNR